MPRLLLVVLLMAGIMAPRASWEKELLKEHAVDVARAKDRVEGVPVTNPYETFLTAQSFVERFEGGYSNIKEDKGGETKFGISKRAYPKLDIKNLTRKQAREIYRRDYWDRIKGDQLPPDVARVMFDTAINSGVGLASKHLQLMIGADPDGVIGPRTMKKLNKYLSQHDQYTLAQELINKRRWFITRLAKKDPSQQKFYSHWMDRINALEKEIAYEEFARREAILSNIAEKAL